MIVLVMTMIAPSTTIGFITLTAKAQQKNQVTLTAMLPDNSGGNPTEDQKERLFQPAIQELRTRHPELDIKINYVRAPYNQTREMMLSAFARDGEEYLIGINQTLLAVSIKVECMPFGPGLI